MSKMNMLYDGWRFVILVMTAITNEVGQISAQITAIAQNLEEAGQRIPCRTQCKTPGKLKPIYHQYSTVESL